MIFPFSLDSFPCYTGFLVAERPLDRSNLSAFSPGDDWSWRIRYTAVQGLVNVCSQLENNKMADGLYNIAWKFLLDANSYEQDERVLEALKVGQVCNLFIGISTS